jgi:hypothetical protein
MKCPHCGVGIHEDFNEALIKIDKRKLIHQYQNYDYFYKTISMLCPECSEAIIFLETGKVVDMNGESMPFDVVRRVVFPENSMTPVSELVPEKYRNEYEEALETLEVSPKASATLSRRLLQMVLQEELNIKKKDLELEIQEYEKSQGVSSEFIKLLQLLRKVGNFGAHPKKKESTSEIVEVEKGEAEISIKIIEKLFDEVFVKPALLRKDIDMLESKYVSKKENTSQNN